MIKQGLKNYFYNLKYIYVPLVAIAIGLIIGLLVFYFGVKSSLDNLAEQFESLFNNGNIDVTKLETSFLAALKSLDWNSPYSAIKTMLSTEWLVKTISSSLSLMVDSEISTTGTDAIGIFSLKLSNLLTLLITFATLGIFVGYLIAKWLIGKKIASKTFWRSILVAVIDFVISTGLAAVCVWLSTLWRPSIAITTIISLLIFGFVSLFEGYVAHARKRIRFKKIVNFKNVIQLFVTDLLIFLISAIVIILIMLINTIAAIIIGIALVEIAFIIVSLNAESYVKSVAKTSKY